MKRREALVDVAVVLLLAMLLIGCGATAMEQVDPALVGTWTGECEISLPVVFNPNDLPEGTERTRQGVSIIVTINEGATVEGSVGDAVIEASQLKNNRGDLGRRLNVATDYIVMDGFLSGPIVAGADETELKDFSIPFNVADDQVQGSLFWRKARRYPYPICPRLVLVQE